MRFSHRLIRWKETLITTAVTWVPLWPGRLLRRLLYPMILGKMGIATEIETGVELMNADLIELGDQSKLDRNVRIKNIGRTTQICLGDRVRIGQGVQIKAHAAGEGKIEIGESTIIGSYSSLSGLFIHIGKDCLIAPQVCIFANNHVFADPHRKIREQGHTYQGIVIEDDCWLGAGVRVLDGVTIGEGSVIGAGAVVTKDIPPYSVAVGVPAKVVAQRGEEEKVAQLDFTDAALVLETGI